VAAAGEQAGSPPDLSTMSPRERFDRLFNRIMTAAEAGNAAEVTTFLPMARMAYAQLDTVNIDARYHMAMLDVPGDCARADRVCGAPERAGPVPRALAGERGR
jgi:hypothetical protein